MARNTIGDKGELSVVKRVSPSGKVHYHTYKQLMIRPDSWDLLRDEAKKTNTKYSDLIIQLVTLKRENENRT